MRPPSRFTDPVFRDPLRGLTDEERLGLFVLLQLGGVVGAVVRLLGIHLP